MPLLASTLASYAGAFVLVGRSRMGLGLLRVSLELARELARRFGIDHGAVMVKLPSANAICCHVHEGDRERVDD